MMLLVLVIVLYGVSVTIGDDFVVLEGTPRLRAEPKQRVASSEDILEVQEYLRALGASGAGIGVSSISRKIAIGDDDHVWSSAPTGNTHAPTPSGTVSQSATCLNNCPSYNAKTWNLDNWCKFYWDAQCYLPDTNFLNINPAGKKLVSQYECVPSCMSASSCGATYCKEFSHLYSSCRTGYAHLLFNATLQDETHDACMLQFMNSSFTSLGWPFSVGNLTRYTWIAAFTLTSTTLEELDSDKERAYRAIESATAHVLSGVSAKDVSISQVTTTAINAPTVAPTRAFPYPTGQPTSEPSRQPTGQPTASPTPNSSVFCGPLAQNSWCNDKQNKNIQLGKADSAAECQAKCNAYIGLNIESCCLWYVGNNEPAEEHGYKDCSIQPGGTQTTWDDNNEFWSSMCPSGSAAPTYAPTVKPSVVPTPVPTPIPSKQPSVAPSGIPSSRPSIHPTDPTQAPTQHPTYAAEGVRVLLRINATTESLGLPPRSNLSAYLQLSGELKAAFIGQGFRDSLYLTSVSMQSNKTKDLFGGDVLTSLPGYNAPVTAPTAAPSLIDNTPAPTPTLFFAPQNSSAALFGADSTAVIAGSATAGVIGTGVMGVAAYNYASSGLVKVATDPAAGIEALSV